MKKRIVSLLMAIALMCAPALATGLDDLFGGLTSLFSADDEAVGVGEVVELDGMTIELINVLEDTGNGNYTPESGNVFLIFEFEVENTSDEELVMSTMMCFSAWCDDKLYTLSLEALGTATIAGKYQMDCVVEPGKSATGVIGYEVPEDWQSAKVEFTKEAFSSEKATFAVSK